ncbi:MAG: LTA synthase family protein, partial [Myxococcales bacterium]|nr:LTA synthase family protein [Myxococcales bacterium]
SQQSLVTRLGGRLLWGAMLLIGVASAFVRGLDIGHCHLGESHWTSQAFLYLDGGFAGTMLQGEALFLVIAVVVVAGLQALSLVRDTQTVIERAAPAPGSRWLALVLVAATIPALWAVRDGVAFPAHAHAWRLVPETNFAITWAASKQRPDDADARKDLKVADAAWQRLKTAAVVPANARPTDPFPLLRRGLDEPPFPYPDKAGVASLRPNVVITFLESTNTFFVHGLSGRHKGLMPELGKLAAQMTRVDGFRNTSSPTIGAMVAALCGVHPASHPYDLDVGESVDGRTAYTCLADRLKRHGYRTVYVQGASRRVTSKEYFFRTHGFDEVYGKEDLRKQWPKRRQGRWGFFDRDTLAFAQEQVTRLEALQKKDGRPFLLVTLTLDTHEPGMGPDPALPLGADGQVKGMPEAPTDEPARLLLAGYRSSDAALGPWGAFLLEPARAARTMVLMTADHAAFRHLLPKSVFLGEYDKHGLFERVPFLLHDPLHKLPKTIKRVGGTTDVTPTLLHALGLDAGLNSLGGLSLFGRRADVPVLVGRVGVREAYVFDHGVEAEWQVGAVVERCKANQPLGEGFRTLTACDLVAWMRWSDALWSLRRLFPAEAYFGGQGVDEKALALDMYLNKKEERMRKKHGKDWLKKERTERTKAEIEVR